MFLKKSNPFRIEQKKSIKSTVLISYVAIPAPVLNRMVAVFNSSAESAVDVIEHDERRLLAL